jgi:hypothetical protein
MLGTWFEARCARCAPWQWLNTVRGQGDRFGIDHPTGAKHIHVKVGKNLNCAHTILQTQEGRYGTH